MDEPLKCLLPQSPPHAPVPRKPLRGKTNDQDRHIGLGWWGKQIVTCLKESPRFTVVAGCDVDHNMAAPFARETGFDLITDYPDLLKRSDIDAIVVVTPHLASNTVQGSWRSSQSVVDQILQMVAGECPACLIDPSVWPGRVSVS